MLGKMPRAWPTFAFDFARLGFEAQQVVLLRLMKLAAGGPAARAEATRMVSEKAFAAAEAATSLAMGGSGRKVVRRYRTRVKANARRLSKSKRRS
jgi:hypothetical protein